MPKGRILAVDDQRYFRELLEGFLVDAGFEAVTASSGEEALRILDQSSFDVVLTDLVMPGMDGSELVRRLKERDPDQDVVVVTGVVDVRTAVDAMKLGATDYVLKPFDRSTLAVSLETILERRRLADEHARLLAENIEYLGERSLLERAVSLFSCLALEPLAERMLEAMCQETGAQGGVLWIAGADGRSLDLASARGLVRVEREPRTLDPGLLPADLREGKTRSALARWGDGDAGDRPALSLALRREGRLLGVVRLTDKLGADGFGVLDCARAAKLVGFAEAALGNALRLRGLERRTLEDPRTGAYVLEYFEDVVRNEIEKANRFGRHFSLLKIDLEGEVGRHDGEEDRDAWLAETARHLRELLRATDLLAVKGEASFVALLPEVDALGASALKRRAARALDGAELELDARAPRCQLGAVTYPADGSQLEVLLRTLDERVEEDRRSPVTSLGLDALAFGEALDRLLEQGSSEHPDTCEHIVRFAIGEAGRRPRDRALLYAAPGLPLGVAVRDGLELLRGIRVQAELCVLQEGQKPAWVEPHVGWASPGRLGDPPPFLIHFGDGPAYVLVRTRKDGPDGTRLFHSDDRSLVEYLAFRLQRELSAPREGSQDVDADATPPPGSAVDEESTAPILHPPPGASEAGRGGSSRGIRE